MNKFTVFAVMGKGYIVVNTSKNAQVFSGTLEECVKFKNKYV